MSYDALLLDFDGVVVQVMGDEKRLPSFREEVVRLGRDDGIDLDSSVIDALAHGVSPSELQSLSEQTGLDGQRLWRYRDDALEAVFQQAARNGSKIPYDDVRSLSDLACPIGVASNNQQRVVEFLAETHGLADHFESIHAREPHPDSLHRKKPNPTFLEAAMADLQAENPLYVGDRGSDILAGERAGLDTALIRRRHNADRQVEYTPTYEVETLAEVVDLLDTPT